MVSLYDIVDFTTRGGTKSQGGSPGNFGAVTAVSDTVASERVREIPIACSIYRCGT